MSSPWLLLILKHLLPYLIRFTVPHSSSYLTNMYLLLYFPLNRFLRLSSIPVEALFHLCYFSCKCRTGHSPFLNNHICEIRGCIFSWPAKHFYQIEQNFAGMIIRKKEIQGLCGLKFHISCIRIHFKMEFSRERNINVVKLQLV